MVPYIDFHTHHTTEDPEVIEVLSCHEEVIHSVGYYTCAYHPWYQNEKLTQKQLDYLRNQYVSKPFCLGIGECGLDKFYGAPMLTQIEIFRQHLDLAVELHAPLIIHCVGRFNELLALRKEYPQALWCVHGYNKHKQLAGTLLDSGIYLSVSPDHTWIKSKMDLLNFLPLDQIFIESDGKSHIPIQNRYEVLSSARNVSIDHTKEQIFHNFKKFYEEKWTLRNGWKEQSCW